MSSNSTTNPLFSALRGGSFFILLVLSVGALTSLFSFGANAYVEIMWHTEVGYGSVFWKRVVWEWGARIGVAIGVGCLVFLNLRVVAATLTGIQIKRRFGNLEISEQIPRSYVLMGVLGISALLALWFGAGIPNNLGLQALLLSNASPWGITDPIHAHDVSFYVFQLPVLLSFLMFALILNFLVISIVIAGYAATGAIRWGGGNFYAENRARLHLAILLAIFLVLMGARFWFERYALLLNGTSEVSGIFGYTDAQARIPTLQTLAGICVFAAIGVLWSAKKKLIGLLIGSLVMTGLAVVLIGQVYPGFIQRFRVEPNELESETPYIEFNLEFTRNGFGLAALERKSFEYEVDAAIDWASAAQQFSGLPVWSAGALLTTYRELEARFPYYDFRTVAVDRYDGPEGPVPVALAVREIEPLGIQDPNWQNRVLRERYVEGMGAVASLASTRTPEGRPPMLISGIPPEVADGSSPLEGLDLEFSQVFFGTRTQDYAVVNPSAEQFQALDGTVGVPGVDFPKGIELGSRVTTGLLAWRFRDWNLLFSSELNSESNFIYRRRVADRIRAIAPFLLIPEQPYPIVANGRVMWMTEGFIGSRTFPLSSTQYLGAFGSDLTYVRNSVKVLVDGVTGEVAFYRVPVDDPILDAYQLAFPELFRPMTEMPEEARKHLRYSREFLNLQSRVLLQYHQETAPTFHGQQDVWASPQELAEGTNPVPYQPEYGIYKLPGENEARFHLTTVFVPAGRQNLTAILAAGTDQNGVPDVVLFDVSVADQISGPRQIEALVEQDPEISQQFSLWRTGGSDVWTGHLHVVPVGNRILYMEPVFLAAEADAIPELRRFVVSDGRRVAMTEQLSGAISQLADFVIPEQLSIAMEQSAERIPAAMDLSWSTDALDLLERAEARAREGDWSGFGEALEELRLLLEQLNRDPR